MDGAGDDYGVDGLKTDAPAQDEIGQEALRAFAARVGQQTPTATLSLLAIFTAVFMLEQYLGGPTSPVLLRLGALSAERIAHGEWWRLVTCTVLHAGWSHLLLNSVVLLTLGTFLEGVIGTARFTVLYSVSALAGSVGSALLLPAAFSVGASGAIWGLLAAYGVLGFRPNGLLPAALVPRVRKTAAFNLAINLASSFLPHVDKWAHFAGGAAGAVLVLSGLLTRSLPRYDSAQPGDGALALATPFVLRATAASAVLLLLTSMIAAVLVSEPFAIAAAPNLVRTEFAAFGVALRMPSSLQRRPVQDAGDSELLFGDLQSDPMAISVQAIDGPSMDAAERSAAVSALAAELQAAEGDKPSAPPAAFAVSGGAGLLVRYKPHPDMSLERAFLVRSGKQIRVEVMRWSAHSRAAPAGLAQQVVSSAVVLPRSADRTSIPLEDLAAEPSHRDGG